MNEKVIITKASMDAIANAIREKRDEDTEYLPSEMPAAIQGITGVVQPLNATQNGIYTPPSGVDGYSPVTVNVSGGGSSNILSGSSEPTAAQGSDGDVYLRYLDVPSGYTKLEYIQSDGNQYIDTGYIPTQTTSAKLKLNSQNTYESAILGSSWAMNGFFLMFYASRFRWHSGSSADSDNIYTNTDYVVEVSNTKLVVDNTAYGVSAGIVVQQAIRLFSTTVAGGSGASNTKGSFKLYYCNIYESNILAMSLIPAKRNADDVVGLYDVVGGSFYTNGGSGSFTAGAEISDKPITSAKLKVSGAWQDLIGSNIEDVGI